MSSTSGSPGQKRANKVFGGKKLSAGNVTLKGNNKLRGNNGNTQSKGK
jgi:hypothetical protein